MSHFVLADRGHASQTVELDGRYGEEVMLLMLRELRSQKVDLSQCQAKIFGGGNMFPQQTKTNIAFNIGVKNGEAARRLLQSYGIRVVSESLYGVGHRQIIFDLATGHVWSRQIKLHNAPARTDTEQKT